MLATTSILIREEEQKLIQVLRSFNATLHLIEAEALQLIDHQLSDFVRYSTFSLIPLSGNDSDISGRDGPRATGLFISSSG